MPNPCSAICCDPRVTPDSWLAIWAVCRCTEACCTVLAVPVFAGDSWFPGCAEVCLEETLFFMTNTVAISNASTIRNSVFNISTASPMRISSSVRQIIMYHTEFYFISICAYQAFSVDSNYWGRERETGIIL